MINYIEGYFGIHIYIYTHTRMNKDMTQWEIYTT